MKGGRRLHTCREESLSVRVDGGDRALTSECITGIPSCRCCCWTVFLTTRAVHSVYTRARKSPFPQQCSRTISYSYKNTKILLLTQRKLHLCRDAVAVSARIVMRTYVHAVYIHIRVCSVE